MRVNNWVALFVLAGAIAYLVRVKGPQEHMRIDEDGTVHIVTADGTPIEAYAPVNPAERAAQGGSALRQRSAKLWGSITGRWAGEDDGAGRADPASKPEKQKQDQK
jgi:hypothetical protein